MPELSIRSLGSFEVTLGGQPVSYLGYDKVCALLAYLAVKGDRGHRPEVLATQLWPEQPAKVARHSLRRVIGGGSRLLADRNSVRIHPRAGAFVDVVAMRGCLARTRSHPHADLESCPVCIPALQRAADLYRGDFLEGLLLGDCAEFETWAVTVREGRRSAALDQ